MEYYTFQLALLCFSIAFIIPLLWLQHYFHLPAINILNVSALFTACSVLLSLAVSYYIYDLSDLYKFSWLTALKEEGKGIVVNIHAGFDETSSLLSSRYTSSQPFVLDFYDPVKHTEVSIRRARKAHTPLPNTVQVSTNHLPVTSNSADKVFLILSAHEIRDRAEKIDFFTEVNRILKDSGQVIVTEHLRNTANFCAYNIGCLHFHSKRAWMDTFAASGLQVTKEIKITPFITTFILKKNGAAY